MDRSPISTVTTGAMMNSSTSSSAPPATVSRLRQKRIQVARACDGCRVQRIKCDNSQPCSNCVRRGRDCSNNETTRTSTLVQAHDEIGQLKERIRALEGELATERGRVSESLVTPPSSSSMSSAHTSPLPIPGLIASVAEKNTAVKAWKQPWQGVKLCPTRSPNESWFGPSSLYYFVKRLNSSLSTTLRQTQPTDRLLLCSTSSSTLLEGRTTQPDPSKPAATYLNPTQEQYFIDLYWDAFHTCVIPILDEAEFKEHHQSLWTTATTRKPSALVDIVLAMCMQLGVSAAPGVMNTQTASGTALAENAADACIAGRMHYRRCQALLAHEMESPSLSTLQCHLLCAAYLCGGSFHNMVDNACGQAVRTAYTLGLHLDPPPGTPPKEAERRRRLWWAVYLMETKIGIKLGRPFQIRDSHAMPALPADDFPAAVASGSRFAPIGDNVTWLSFNLHHVKLHQAAREAYTAFYDHDPSGGQRVWDDTDTLEAYADLLQPHIKTLDDWAAAVPPALKTRRRAPGTPLSTHPSDLDIEQFAPLWLQRQRLLLEIAYHNLAVTLCRPFISFSAPPGPAAADLANKCAAHGIALTRIAHQVLTASPTLDGWHEVFHWQWSVAMTLVGFVLAYPRCDLRPAARDAIDRAVIVFDTFSKSFAVGASAAGIVRELCVKIDLLQAQHEAETEGVAQGAQAQFPALDLSMSDMALSDGAWDGQNLFDMALNVDFWSDMDKLWPGYQGFPEGTYGQM